MTVILNLTEILFLQTMQKVMEVGVQYLKEEGGLVIARTRLSRVDDDRKFVLDKKLNILESFLIEATDEPLREAAYPYISGGGAPTNTKPADGAAVEL
jgi:hypothetical protein